MGEVTHPGAGSMGFGDEIEDQLAQACRGGVDGVYCENCNARVVKAEARIEALEAVVEAAWDCDFYLQAVAPNRASKLRQALSSLPKNQPAEGTHDG